MLSNAEVLSLVLGSGGVGVCPLGLARELLAEPGGVLDHLIVGNGGRGRSLRDQGVV